MTQGLKIGIVGHTNTGKTSLIRTLLRNSQFGEVKDQAGTTRHVETATITAGQFGAVELRDTPGLEDSSGLKNYLDSQGGADLSGRQLLTRCIENAAQLPDFEQEIKVLKQSLECDVLFYVVDSREPIFEKYLHEIEILRLASIPIIPVLNFIYFTHSHVDAWRDKLAELGLHAMVLFDTVAYDFSAEKKLYQKIQSLLESEYDLVQAIIDQRAQDWQELKQTLCKRVAHLFLDVCKIETSIEDNQPKLQAVERLKDEIKQKEQETLSSILKLMQFNQDDVEMFELPVHEGEWSLDLFSPETLKRLGLDSASAMAAGASIGVGADLIFGGMSLGMGAATGAALGAVWHGSRKWGKSLVNQLRGHKVFRVDDETLNVLLLRQLWLLDTVFNRGHAATQASTLKDNTKIALRDQWEQQKQNLKMAALNLGESEQQFLERFTQYLMNSLVNLKH